MKVAFYTVDYCQGREYLMPWRTILEVAKVMKESGYDVTILNACYDPKIVMDYSYSNVEVQSVHMGNDAIVKKCKELNPDVLFVPMTFRSGLKPNAWFADINCKKIVYLAGGVYDLQSSWMLYRQAGLSIAKPYLIEVLTPKWVFAKSMRRLGVNKIIGLTDVTTNMVKKAGFENSVTIYPGKDAFNEIDPDNSIINKYDLAGKKWLLFSGAPAPTRGAELLIKAIDIAKDESLRLVMLMRTDVGSSYSRLKHALEKMQHPERVKIIKEKMTREQLRAFFGGAYYALLPFIVIPSEVPLTYFELLSCGTPIITFRNGGTTEYLKDSLLIAEKNIKGLAKALDKVWNNDAIRRQLSENGKRVMSVHPSWQEVGLQWINLLNN